MGPVSQNGGVLRMNRRVMMPLGLLPLITLLIASMMSTATAQSLTRSEPSDGWSFTFAPYVWAAGIEGEAATLPPAPPAQVDAGFDDILDNLDVAFMGIAEARKGRFGLLADIVYTKLSIDGQTPGPFFSGADVELKTFVGTFEGAYHAVVEKGKSLALLAGLRVWSTTTELSLGAGILPAQRRKDTETWVDPIIGIQGRVELGANVYLTGLAHVGGFGIASDITWDIFGGLGYAFNDRYSAVIGYRHLAVDYEKGSFLFDVEMSGPVIGGVIRF